VPRTHQFLVTLTVHTNKINPAATPTVTSADSMKNGHPVVAIQRDGQQVGRNSIVVWKNVQDSQIDSKWQSIPIGRAQ